MACLKHGMRESIPPFKCLVGHMHLPDVWLGRVPRSCMYSTGTVHICNMVVGTCFFRAPARCLVGSWCTRPRAPTHPHVWSGRAPTPPTLVRDEVRLVGRVLHAPGEVPRAARAVPQDLPHVVAQLEAKGISSTQFYEFPTNTASVGCPNARAGVKIVMERTLRATLMLGPYFDPPITNYH